MVNCQNVTNHSTTEQKLAPNFSIFRANEDYAYLKVKEENLYQEDLFDAIKFIPLERSRSSYFTIGGEVRPRFEYFENRKWKEENLAYYSQRLSLHSNFQFGKNLRLFVELYHGFTSHIKRLPNYDKIDFHQLFIEYRFNISLYNKLSFSFGRQELMFGTSRLITLREGPNIRQDFDIVKIILDLRNTKMQLFYCKEVRANIEAFDNAFTLFDNDAPNASLWGFYTQFEKNNLRNSVEIYYLGFHSGLKTFSDVSGEELRHTLGIRFFGATKMRWRYNTEIMYQFGNNDGNKIRAFNIETDWGYTLSETGWNPTPGLKLVYSSGDKAQGDGKLGTFNPLYVSPNIYNLSSTLVPINVISVHPSFRFKPNKKSKLLLEYVLFWRTALADGIYSPPGVILRQGGISYSRNLGSQFAIDFTYSFDKHLSFNLNTSYYIAGLFQKETGESKNIFHFAPTISYKF